MMLTITASASPAVEQAVSLFSAPKQMAQPTGETG